MEVKMKKIRAVIYDMDGTLLDSEKLWTNSPLEVLSSLGIKTEEHPAWLYSSFHKSVREYLKGDSASGLTVDGMEEMCYAVMRRHYEGHIPLKAGAEELLRATAGVKTMVLSNTATPGIEKQLTQNGVRGLVRHVKSLNGKKLNKHYPLCFLLAALSMGCLPRDCLVVEDSPYAIENAKKAGCSVWAVYDECHDAETDKIKGMCDEWFPDLGKAAERFGKLTENE